MYNKIIQHMSVLKYPYVKTYFVFYVSICRVINASTCGINTVPELASHHQTIGNGWMFAGLLWTSSVAASLYHWRSIYLKHFTELNSLQKRNPHHNVPKQCIVPWPSRNSTPSRYVMCKTHTHGPIQVISNLILWNCLDSWHVFLLYICWINVHNIFVHCRWIDWEKSTTKSHDHQNHTLSSTDSNVQPQLLHKASSITIKSSPCSRKQNIFPSI